VRGCPRRRDSANSKQPRPGRAPLRARAQKGHGIMKPFRDVDYYGIDELL